MENKGTKYFNLTIPQENIWMVEQLNPNTTINNIYGTLTIDKKLDLDILKKAINFIIEKNDALRIRITWKDAKPVQYISDYEYDDLPVYFLEDSEQEKLDKIVRLTGSEHIEILDNKLYDFRIIYMPNRVCICVKMHHIIADAWSTAQLFVEQLNFFYSAIENGENIAKKPSYLNYIEKNENYKESNKYSSDKAFWEKYVQNLNCKNEFPLVQDKKSKRIEKKLDKNLYTQIRNFCKNNEISEYTFFLSIISIYFSKVFSNDNIIIGTPFLNRKKADKEFDMMGMFISTLPININIPENSSFVDLCKQVNSTNLSCFKHSKFPYNEIQKAYSNFSGNNTNLYEISFSYQINNLEEDFDKNIYKNTWIPNNYQNNPLLISYFNHFGEHQLCYDYILKCFEESEIDNIHNRLIHVISQIISNTTLEIRNIEIVTPEEKQQILYDFNNTKTIFSKDKTMIELFEEQVKTTPDNIAVVFEDQKLTYHELNEKANRLAYYLKDNGITNTDVISILLNRSLELIIAIFGVMKSGASYVLIDTTFPEDRIHYIISNSNSKFCITNNSLYNLVNLKNPINIDNLDFSNYKSGNLDLKMEDNLCIIYTSGSTGNPKGVLLHKKGFFNLIYAFDKEMKVSNYKNILGIATVSFDMFSVELFCSLLFGNTLILANEEEQKNPIKMSNLIKKNKVDFLITTPSRMELLLLKECENPLKNVKAFQLGGEKLTNNLYKKLQNLTNAQMFNGYGPTEITACCSNKLINSEDITIGKPISNVQIYICDSNLNLLPPNVVGEICVAGIGVSNGYLNNEEATHKNFIKNPFGDGFVYKTGDLGKFRKNGEIEYIGRSDFQVKLRGLRIEPDEIENKIYELSNITSCVVVKKTDSLSHDFLCAYFTATSNIDSNIIRKHLEGSLPKYMIPHYFIQMESLPSTHNGKIDRKKLPEPKYETLKKEIVLPRNEIDTKLINLLKDILKVDCISINESFFDLGGDSLSAITLCIKIQNLFNCELFVKDILENPIIQDISDIIIKNKNTMQKQIIKKTIQSNFYPISSAQKRIYFASQISGNASILYNSPGGVIFYKNINVSKLEKCINTLIKRHEVFRTYFEATGEGIVQKISDTIDFKLDILNNCNFNKLQSLFDNFVKPFDLSKAPLFRAKFINFTNGKSILFFDTHHIIFDGTSMNIFIDELCKLYNGDNLNELEITYKDFAVFENEILQAQHLKEAENYWVHQFDGEIPVLNMPTNRPRPAVQSFEGKKVYSTIDKDLTQKIEQLSKKFNITPYMLLLASYYILLAKYTSQNDIVIGSPVIGRDNLETYNLIGMFVNTLALRNTVDGNLSFKEFVLHIKENISNSFKYQTYPFDELVTKLGIKRDTSRNPLFDTMFIYQNNGFKPLNFDDVKSEFYVPDTNISKFDLSVEAIPNNNKIDLSFEYATKLFDEDFIQNLSVHFLNIVNTVVNNADIKIANIGMLSEDEKNKVLYEFNNTKVDYPEEKTLSVLFEEQVLKTPNNIAVAFENQQITFRELNEKANSLAYYLRKNGIKPNDLVGVMVSRSLEMIVSILAVLKSGGAYIPIDPTYPNDRIDYMLSSSNSKMLLTQRKLINKVEFDTKVIVDLDNTDIYSLPNENLENVNSPEDLFYIIFTSGSTGKPKGVMMMHKTLSNFTNYCNNYVDYLKNPIYRTIISITTISFDIFVYETFISLQKGLKVVIANENEQTSPALLNKLIEEHGAEIIQSTPSIMQIFVNNLNNMPLLKKLKYITLAGEQLPLNLVNTLHSLCNVTIYNGYGPSETNYATLTEMNDIMVTIGKPLYNDQIYILDKYLNPVPIGVTGEIYISGYGVAKGYLNNEDLTQKSFIPNPFIPEQIMYKSGDLGMFLKDGNILCLGRSDFQVKIRGLRIELGEIESLIAKYPNIKKVTVIKQTIQNREFISAYFVANKRIAINELRKYLSRSLPRYMVPSYFIPLDDLPYTFNGKIDRKALPLPDKILNVNKEEYVAPQTNLQKQLVAIWEKVLNTEPIGINDNFFELGGDSLLAMNLNVELLKISNKLNYSDIFRFPTISEQEEKINSDDSQPIFSKIENLSDNYVDILDNNKNKEKLQNWHPKNILLTGGTGYLGVHILDAFLQKESGNVYCIVRDELNLTAKAKLHQKLNYYFGNKYDDLIGKRIFTITGNITEPGFGLQQDELLELANSVDVVINCAARVAHFGNYDDFFKANVKSVQYMINFCQTFHKKLYHISTTGVSSQVLDTSYLFSTPQKKWLKINKKHDIIFDESRLYIGQILDSVYARSKFEAESYVLNAISHGLDGYILRMGNLMPRLNDGVFQENILDNAFVNRLATFMKIGAIPDYLSDYWLEFTPVDCAAQAIYQLIIHPTNQNRIFHVYHPKNITMKKYLKLLKSFGYDLKILPEQEFKQKIKTILQDDNLQNNITNIVPDFNQKLHLTYKSNIVFKSDFSFKYLKKAHFRWPRITRKYLIRFINLLRTVI